MCVRRVRVLLFATVIFSVRGLEFSSTRDTFFRELDKRRADHVALRPLYRGVKATQAEKLLWQL
jgi:hypothetical protein